MKGKRLLKDRMVTVVIWLVIAFTVMATLHFVRWIFVADKFIVPSESMSPTLVPGDRILVNKLLFGARIYRKFDFSEHAPLESWRMRGLCDIAPDDVIVFNYPLGYDDWDKIEFKINYVYAKRVIGVPGDTVLIVDGFYENNNYEGIFGVADSQERLAYTQDSVLEKRSILKTFAHSSGWTIKNMGPLYVPKQGDVITMGEKEFDRYRLVIEYETGGKILLTTDGVYLNESKQTEYTFCDNYYFVGGDNVFNSRDSRYIGFVPEEFIVGIATRVLYSRDKQTNRINWKRVWLKI